MAVPKKKKSIQKRGGIIQHHRVKEVAISRCDNCARLVLRHFACASCFKK